MGLSYTFANYLQWQAAWLDTNFSEVGACATIPCTITGTNALILTPLSNTPAPTDYANYQVWGGVAAADNTGAVTANPNGLGVLSVFKDTAAGPAPLTGGEIYQDTYIVLVYDGALDTGNGGFHLMTAPSTAVGTITEVVANTGLSGGGASGSVTISIATIADNRLLANISGGTAAPEANSLSDILDTILSDTQGTMAYRGASLWNALAPGTEGQFLYTGGTATNPAWTGGVATTISAAGTVQGDATQLSAEFNRVTTAAAGTGVKLAATVGLPQWVWDDGANNLLLYPPSGAQIDSNGTNNPVTITVGSKGCYVMLSGTIAKTLA